MKTVLRNRGFAVLACVALSHDVHVDGGTTLAETVGSD